MVVEIFTYTNGDVAKQVMNAIAVLFKSDGFASIIQVAAMFSLVATSFHYFMKQDHKDIGKWAAVYFAVPFLFNITATVQITDLTDPTGNYRVDNVPIIVALPSSWASRYMYAVTKTVEDVFHVPNDEQYSKTGMMFGAKLYRLSSHNEIENSQLKSYWQHYMSSCIRGDILLNNKYTWKQLANAPDIWQFLAENNPSPLRAIKMGNDYPVCKDALPRLKRMFEAESAQNIKLLGSWVYGNKATSNEAFLTSSMQNGYQKYANISKSASQITLQNMTINALRNGLADDAAMTNNTAAAFNYAYTQNKMQTTSMWAGMALQAREFLPMLQSILFLLFSCVAFLVVALAMIPQFTALVLGNYIKGFIYLGTWPVMFALINFIMTTRLSLNTSAVADIYHGITLSNTDALQEMHSRYAAMTGFLMMSVPVLIVPLLMKGGAAVMSSMSHQFAGMMNSVNSRTSASAASGDINLGNAQVDNYSYNNTHANKLDTTSLDRSYGNTVQSANGYETTTFDSGKQVINGQNAISSGLEANISGSNVMSQSLSQSASQMTTASLNAGEQTSQNIRAAANSAMSLTSGTSENQTYGSNASVGDSGTSNKGFSDMSSLASSYAKEFGVSKVDAYNDLFTMYAGAEAGAKVGTPGAGFFGSSASLSANAGMKGSTDESNSTQLSDSERESKQQSYNEQFTSAINTVKSFNTGEQVGETNSKSQGETTSFLRSLDQSVDSAKTQQSLLAQAQQYSEAANRVESGDLAVNRNLNQDFVNYVGRAEGSNTEAIIHGDTAETRAMREQYIQEFTQSDQVKSYAAQLVSGDLPQSHNDVKNSYQAPPPVDFNKVQQDNISHQASIDILGRNSNEPIQDYYAQAQYDRINGTAQQGVNEIRTDVYKDEPQHIHSQVTSIDREQALADAQKEYEFVPSDPILGNAMTEQEKMDKNQRVSNPFNPGSKL